MLSRPYKPPSQKTKEIDVHNNSIQILDKASSGNDSVLIIEKKKFLEEIYESDNDGDDNENDNVDSLEDDGESV